MEKSEIRKIYIAKRLKLTPIEVEEKSQSIANNFIKNLLPKIDNFKNKKLGFYVAINNEVDPSLIISFCKNVGNILSLPKTSSLNRVLSFREYKLFDGLVKNNKYPKLLEPEESKNTIIPDIVFTPLVAFDADCNRIGMGGGFYDATISNYKEKHPKTIFIGLAYDQQQYPIIPKENLDMNLNFVVTENFIIYCN